MTYNKLKSLLPNDELHYREDCTNFFTDNELNPSDFTQYKFIIFSETVDYWTNTINTLKSNNIDFIIKKDEWNLNYVLIK